MELEHTETGPDRADKQRRHQHQPETLGSVVIEKWPERAHGKPERIGRMLMSAEDKPQLPAGKTVETLSRSQLLQLSEEIMIDGSSLRQIYETHLIGERGLRHLVAEYVHDGDLKQALRQEIIERERDFERDPAMRHLAEDVDLSDVSMNSKTTLEELLSKADLATEQSSEETAFFKARARFEAKELVQHRQRRRAIDVVLAAIISLLVLLIILLIIQRH